MFPFSLIPSSLACQIFDKMDPERFLRVPTFNRFCRNSYEANLDYFKQQPVHYIDWLKQGRISVSLERFADDYIKTILMRLQEDRYSPEWIILESKSTLSVDVDKVLMGLNYKMYWRGEDETCVFAEAPYRHIYKPNLAVFTMENRNGEIFAVKLSEYSLSVEKVQENKEQLLHLMWDATRDSSSYKLPALKTTN